MAVYDTWGGSWGNSWLLSWTVSDTPPPEPQTNYGGVWKGHRRKKKSWYVETGIGKKHFSNLDDALSFYDGDDLTPVQKVKYLGEAKKIEFNGVDIEPLIIDNIPGLEILRSGDRIRLAALQARIQQSLMEAEDELILLASII